MTRLTDSIQQFVGYFNSEIDSIDGLTNALHRKVLYATLLDPLARAAFGGGANVNRKRLILLLDNLTAWDSKTLVSLPQLALRLSEAKRRRYRLYRKVESRLSKWSEGAVVPVKESPDLAELALLAGTAEEQKILNSCRYPELFYTFRNNLIHEFREPGYGIEMPNDNEPFYHSMQDSPWQLVFPVEFFATIARQAVDRLAGHLLENKINPYTRFEFGSVWRAN